MNKALVAVGAIWVAAGVVWTVYLARPLEYQAVNITAAADVPDLGLPVYAQFVYTQRLVLHQPALVSRLELPLLVPGQAPTVRVIQAGVVVQEWSKEADYVWPQPQELVGNVEIEISGRHLTHEEAEQAPRVFIESDDAAYPDGNYRVADNEKKGDIALTLYGRRTRGEALLRAWHDRSGPMAGRSVFYLTLIFAASVFPLVVGRRSGVGSSRE